MTVWILSRVRKHSHAGGYGSEDSDAYIPLVKSALQSEVTSRSAEAAPSHQQREAQQAGGVGHLAAAPSKPAQEGTHPSRAPPSGSRASVAVHSTSANGHGHVAEAGEETHTHIKGSKQQPLDTSEQDRHVEGSLQQQIDGSEQSLGGERDDVQASSGLGGKKRKSKGKKGRSRAVKRQTQHDESVEATAEQEKGLGSPEAVPGSYTEQSLSDLREAALTWAEKARENPD